MEIKEAVSFARDMVNQYEALSKLKEVVELAAGSQRLIDELTRNEKALRENMEAELAEREKIKAEIKELKDRHSKGKLDIQKEWAGAVKKAKEKAEEEIRGLQEDLERRKAEDAILEMKRKERTLTLDAEIKGKEQELSILKSALDDIKKKIFS